MKRASCGLDVSFVSEISSTLKLASTQGYEFVCLPLVHPRFKREFTEKCKDREGPFTRSDLVLNSREWNSLIAGKISPYINFESEILFNQSKCALEQELSYGNHLAVPAIIISLKSSNCYNLARIINSNLSSLKPYQVWVEVPLINKNEEAAVWRTDSESMFECTWEWWNTFRTLCNSDKRIGLVLEISKKLPPQRELLRWLGEPIKCLAISTSTFFTNRSGYPVLLRSHQSFIKSLVSLHIQVIIKGNNHHFDFGCYQKYIDHLWQEAITLKNLKIENISSTYKIQWPLQPVATNNIVSRIYESFETNYVKYHQYLKAIHLALVNNRPQEEKYVNIMVVEAGRGPLVMVTLQAAIKARRRVKVYAVEKNPHAVVSLQAFQEELWHSTVEVIASDIRSLGFSEKVDIIVSESLGSFGDNALLPEILDEAQKFLGEGGIFIPESYTSHICPVQNAKTFSDLKLNREMSDFEIPFVLKQKSKYRISRCKELFNFHHPNHSVPKDNSRYKRLIFDVEQNCVLHGFLGFFESVLYKNVKLSIVPETHTPGIFNWNPLFFPIMEPVHLKANDKVELQFWRLLRETKVWYEWTITKPIPLPVHNANGHFFNANLQ